MANQELFKAAYENIKLLAPEERRQIINLLHDMSCAQCMHFSGTGCVLAGGKTPPAKVMASGCKNFDYKVPF